MDPEDLREVITAYQKCVAEAVRRFDGFVAKYMGDGVLVYFGYPEAHEDDADRAVRAALELIAAVTALNAPVGLQTRVGIATGLVVVGDLVGSGEAQERGIVGDTPRRALHARIAQTLDSQFPEITESQPELLAHHCTEAGLIEEAAGLWGKAGQRSLALSALVEAAAQLNRALEQIAILPGTPALRREQIKLQVTPSGTEWL